MRAAAPSQAKPHGAKPIPAETPLRVRKEKQGCSISQKVPEQTEETLCFCSHFPPWRGESREPEATPNSVQHRMEMMCIPCLKGTKPGIPTDLTNIPQTFGRGGSEARLQRRGPRGAGRSGLLYHSPFAFLVILQKVREGTWHPTMTSSVRLLQVFLS